MLRKGGNWQARRRKNLRRYCGIMIRWISSKGKDNNWNFNFSLLSINNRSMNQFKCVQLLSLSTKRTIENQSNQPTL